MLTCCVSTTVFVCFTKTSELSRSPSHTELTWKRNRDTRWQREQRGRSGGRERSGGGEGNNKEVWKDGGRRESELEGGRKCQMVGRRLSMSDGRLHMDGCWEDRNNKTRSKIRREECSVCNEVKWLKGKTLAPIKLSMHLMLYVRPLTFTGDESGQ